MTPVNVYVGSSTIPASGSGATVTAVPMQATGALVPASGVGAPVTAVPMLATGALVTPLSGQQLHVGSGQTYSTVQLALAAANPGDTVLVHAGSYARQTVTAVKSDWVAVMPFPGDTPSVAGFTVTGAFIDFRGFTTTGFNRVNNPGHHIKFRFGDATTGSSTVSTFIIPDGPVHDIWIEDNYCHGTVTGTPGSQVGTIQCGFQSFTNNATDQTTWSYNVYVRRNRITGMNQDGCFVDALNDSIVELNEIFDGAQNTNHNDGIQCTSGNNVTLRWNNIYRTDDPTNPSYGAGYGTGIIMEHASGNAGFPRIITGIKCVGNLVHHWHGVGVYCGGTIDCQVVNNTVYDNYGAEVNHDGVGISSFTGSGGTYTNAGTFEAWNNICDAYFHGTETQPAGGYNHVTTPGTQHLGTGGNETNGDPLFVARASRDYRLQSGSACRDSGTTTVNTPTVDLIGRSYLAMDRGAYAA